MGWTAAIPIIGEIIDRVVPDKNAAREAKERLSEMDQKGELDLQLGQLAINKEQAKHSSIFVAGARPFIMWVCGFALAYAYIVYPILKFAVVLIVDEPPKLPVLQIGEMMPVLMGLLGLGGLRSFEKYKGVARESL